jgi:dTDP-glucose pyrophosphorylase
MISYREHLIRSGSLIKEALIQLDRLAEDAILFVVDPDDKLIGALTDGDIRRGLIRGVGIGESVDNVIQPNPHFFRRGNYTIQQVIEYRDAFFRIIPVVDAETRIINVINFREARSYLPVDVVIMAGGKGQRLLPLTEKTPKPLLKVGDKPIIEHNLDRLSLFGIDDFWISVNYLGQQIEDHFGNGADRNVTIQYVKENEPLGTIGSVSKIDNFSHDYILLTNSDILTNLDYEHFFLDFLKNDADLSVVTIPYHMTVPYAVLETNDGCVVNFKEKPTYTYYSNGGIYLFKRSVLSYLPKDQHFNATDLMEALIKDNKKVTSYPLIGYWLDIGSPEDFRKAQSDILNIKF